MHSTSTLCRKKESKRRMSLILLFLLREGSPPAPSGGVEFSSIGKIPIGSPGEWAALRAENADLRVRLLAAFGDKGRGGPTQQGTEERKEVEGHTDSSSSSS